MGVDIHMFVTKGKEIIAENIFNGRNTNWFNNLMGQGNDEEYDELPVIHRTSKDIPDKILEEYESGYYGFSHCTVKEFIDWFNEYRPDVDAGWVTTYEKWKIEHKNYVPDYVCHDMPIDVPIEDLHFVEIVDKHDCSRWLVEYLESNPDVTDDMLIVFYFDC